MHLSRRNCRNFKHFYEEPWHCQIVIVFSRNAVKLTILVTKFTVSTNEATKNLKKIIKYTKS